MVGRTLEDLYSVLPKYPSGSPGFVLAPLALPHFNLFPWPEVGGLGAGETRSLGTLVCVSGSLSLSAFLAKQIAIHLIYLYWVWPPMSPPDSNKLITAGLGHCLPRSVLTVWTDGFFLCFINVENLCCRKS